MDTYEDFTYGIRIKCAPDWTLEHEGYLDAVWTFMPYKSRSSDFIETFVVRVLSLPSSMPNMSLAKYTQMAINEIREFTQEVKITSSVKTVLAGNPAHQICYCGKDSFTGQFELMWIQVWTVKNNKAYILSYCAKVSQFSNFLDDVLKMINSFEIIEPNELEAEAGRPAKDKLFSTEDLIGIGVYESKDDVGRVIGSAIPNIYYNYSEGIFYKKYGWRNTLGLALFLFIFLNFIILIFIGISRLMNIYIDPYEEHLLLTTTNVLLLEGIIVILLYKNWGKCDTITITSLGMKRTLIILRRYNVKRKVLLDKKEISKILEVLKSNYTIEIRPLVNNTQINQILSLTYS